MLSVKIGSIIDILVLKSICISLLAINKYSKINIISVSVFRVLFLLDVVVEDNFFQTLESSNKISSCFRSVWLRIQLQATCVSVVDQQWHVEHLTCSFYLCLHSLCFTAARLQEDNVPHDSVLHLKNKNKKFFPRMCGNNHLWADLPTLQHL